MQIRYYVKNLPPEAKEIREEVFIKEQGFKNELDEIDLIATHIVLYDKEEAIATCRVFRHEEPDTYILGRLAVRKEYRHMKMGHAVVAAAEKYVADKGAERLALHAQCSASRFYQYNGFHETGEVDDDEGCPHIWMVKNLETKQD